MHGGLVKICAYVFHAVQSKTNYIYISNLHNLIIDAHLTFNLVKEAIRHHQHQQDGPAEQIGRHLWPLVELALSSAALPSSIKLHCSGYHISHHEDKIKNEHAHRNNVSLRVPYVLIRISALSCTCVYARVLACV